MNNESLYTMYRNLDRPKRYFGLTIDEVCLAVPVLLLLVLSSQKTVILLLGAASIYGVRKIKKNKSPKMILVKMYWCLPRFITKWFMAKLPDSSRRMWKA